MASAVSVLKKILSDFNANHDVQVSAVISRSGIPIAWVAPDDIHIENFATLAATLMGASDVIYSGLEKEPPTRIGIESRDGFFRIVELGSKAFVAVFSRHSHETLDPPLSELSSRLKEALLRS